MNAKDHQNRLIPLLDKLREQVEGAAIKPEGISLIEKELIKDTLRKLFETVAALPVVSAFDISMPDQMQQVPHRDTGVNPTVASSVLLAMKEFVAHKEPDPSLPVKSSDIPQQVVQAEAEKTMTPPVAVAEPKQAIGTTGISEEKENWETATVQGSAPVTSPAMNPVEAANTSVPAAPKAPVEERVVDTRAKHLYAAAQYEEQATVAAKYTAAETLGEKVIRDAAPRRLADQLKSAPLADLKTSIGINERFAFINELFGGDQQMYFQSIDRINLFQTYEEAKSFLSDELTQRLDWSARPERARQFDELVKRRFHA